MRILPDRSVNLVVEKSAVVPTALDIARQIAMNSPDSVQSSKEGLVLSQKHHFEQAVHTHSMSLVSKRLYHGANIRVRHVTSYLSYGVYSIHPSSFLTLIQEGLAAFSEVYCTGFDI